MAKKNIRYISDCQLFNNLGEITMKTIIASIAFALAFAANAETQATDPVQRACESRGELAASIMRSRQNGVPLSSLMSLPSVQNNQLVQMMIQVAYGEPRYQTPAMQQRSIEDFRNEAELACFMARRQSNT